MTTMTTRAPTGPSDPDTADLLRAELPQVDQAIRASEARWGVGRLETLVSPATLMAWKRGFGQWSEAVWSGDLARVRDLGPKIMLALRVMGDEADARGHAPLAAETWEARCEDGRILVVTRTQAEAHAAVVAQQAAGREAVVFAMDELARLLPKFETMNAVKLTFPGSRVTKLTMRDESFAHDLATDPEMVPVLHGIDACRAWAAA